MLIRVLEAGAWWGVLLAAYLVFISSVTRQEVLTGVVVAALASGVAMIAVRGMRPPRPPTRLRWGRLLRRLPVALVRDVGVLLVRLGARERHTGRVEDLRLPRAGDAAGVRAYAVLAVSISPATYVADLRPGEDEPGTVRVHMLGQAVDAERFLEE